LGKPTLNKGLFFCTTLILFGVLDLATTIIGVTHFGACEANPLLSGIITNSPMMFSAIKLFTAITVGLMFYKASSINGGAANHFLQLSYSFSMIFMTYVVANNVLVVAKLA